MTEVAKIEQREVASADNQMITLIERVLTNPEVPMDRVSALMDLQERQMNKEAEQSFNAAFAAAMAEMPDIPRTGENKHLKRKYSTLDDLIRTARPVLSKHGLSLNWQTGIDDGQIWVRAIVRHSLGHSIDTMQSGPRDKSGSMNPLQGGGSTETYLKRYTGFAILGVSSGDEVDDDGQAAGGQGESFPAFDRQIIDEMEPGAIPLEMAEEVADALCRQWTRKKTATQLSNEWDRRTKDGTLPRLEQFKSQYDRVVDAYEARMIDFDPI